jgi:tRNA-specific 2-thiouridylase
VVGKDEELFVPGLIADNVSWSAIPDLDSVPTPCPALSKIRYNGTATASHLSPAEGDTVEVRFEIPQRAVTPGQAAVFYGGEGEEFGQVVLGGGTIHHELR